MLHIKCFTFNPFQENTYLLYDEEGTATLIDPGCYTEEEKQELEAFILKEKLQVTQLLNTHCHIDHVLGNAWAIDRFQVTLQIHTLEVPVLKSVEVYAPNYGFRDYVPSTASSFLVEGQEIQENENLNISDSLKQENKKDQFARRIIASGIIMRDNPESSTVLLTSLIAFGSAFTGTTLKTLLKSLSIFC